MQHHTLLGLCYKVIFTLSLGTPFPDEEVPTPPQGATTTNSQKATVGLAWGKLVPWLVIWANDMFQRLLKVSRGCFQGPELQTRSLARAAEGGNLRVYRDLFLEMC